VITFKRIAIHAFITAVLIVEFTEAKLKNNWRRKTMSSDACDCFNPYTKICSYFGIPCDDVEDKNCPSLKDFKEVAKHGRLF